MGADLGVPLSDLRLLCVSVARGESRKTFTQFSKRENVKTLWWPWGNVGPNRPSPGPPAAVLVDGIYFTVTGSA